MTCKSFCARKWADSGLGLWAAELISGNVICSCPEFVPSGRGAWAEPYYEFQGWHPVRWALSSSAWLLGGGPWFQQAVMGCFRMSFAAGSLGRQRWRQRIPTDWHPLIPLLGGSPFYNYLLQPSVRWSPWEILLFEKVWEPAYFLFVSYTKFALSSSALTYENIYVCIVNIFFNKSLSAA